MTDPDPIDELAEWLSQPNATFNVDDYLSLFTLEPDDDPEEINKTQFWNEAKQRFGHVEGARRRLTNRARAIARDRAALLIAELNAEKKATVRVLINRAMKNKWSRKMLAGRIATHVGLTARQQTAMENYRLALISQGKSPQEARKLFYVKVRAERAKRARFIADTEVFAVRQQAKRERWAEKAEQGKLSLKWKRTWVTAADERTCIICAPMDGSSTTIGGVYHLKSGAPVPGPPVHPRCRCTEKLILKDFTK